ncbi:ral guanine nucleotide dissociation stimulator-like, partial [Equus quagga]|uniref:ral guanine nucleotide dissociation stimulator-like n=1 Tax=Equus quagga TaxID=89248 RepID=UPI001EE1A3CC
EQHCKSCGWGLVLAKGAVSDGLRLSAFQGNVLNCRKWNEQFKLMEEIELLQEAANLYTVQPDEHFGAWFQAVEPLSKEESYSLSCQLEPRYHWVRKIRLFFKHKKNRSGQNTRPPPKGPVGVVDDPPETS